VFTTSGGGRWSQVAEGTATDGGSFGFSVALSGDGTMAVVGASTVSSQAGAAYSFSTPP